MSTDEDITVCPICLEDFNTKLNIPRLFKCSHTLCHLCIENLIKPSQHYIECPQCRQKQDIGDNGPRSFPQNKYILHFINLQKENKKTKLGRCKEHHRELGLFCKQCLVVICQRCFTSEHKSHNTIDVELKCKNDLDSAINGLIENIQNEKKRCSQAMKQLEQAVSSQISLLENKATESKKYISCNFSEYQGAVQDAHKSNDTTIQDLIKYLLKQETLLNELKHEFSGENTRNDFSTQMEIIKDIDQQILSMIDTTPTLDLVKYIPVSSQEEDKLLQEILGEIRFGDNSLCFKGPEDAKIFKSLAVQHITTFSIQMQIIYGLCPISNKNIVTIGQSSGGSFQLITFDHQGAKLNVSSLGAEPAWGGLAEISTNGKQYIAVAFAQDSVIEFRPIEDITKPSSVFTTYTTRPGALSSLSASDMIYINVSPKPRYVNFLDCRKFPVRHPHTYVPIACQDHAYDLCTIQYNGQKLLITTDPETNSDKGIMAHYLSSGKVAWKLSGKVEGLQNEIKPKRVCSDGVRNVFVIDSNNSCVFALFPDGKFHKVIMRKGEHGIGKLSWIKYCSQTKCLIIGHTNNKERISIFKIL